MYRSTIGAAVIAVAMMLGGTVAAQQDQPTAEQRQEMMQQRREQMRQQREQMREQREQMHDQMQRDQAQQDLNPDQLFVKMAAIDNRVEIRLSELAQNQAESRQVQQLAQRMVQDHRQVDQQLERLARQLNVELPQELPELQEEKIAVFQQLHGEEFDRHYLSAMKAAHAKKIAELEDLTQLAEDRHLQHFARQQLPGLQQHEQQVLAQARQAGLEARPAAGRIEGDERRPRQRMRRAPEQHDGEPIHQPQPDGQEAPDPQQ